MAKKIHPHEIENLGIFHQALVLHTTKILTCLKTKIEFILISPIIALLKFFNLYYFTSDKVFKFCLLFITILTTAFINTSIPVLTMSAISSYLISKFF